MSKYISVLSASALILALYVTPGLAHDPKEHKAKSTMPDCAAMKNMDASKMDMNDPVMKAMMQKCRGEKHADEHSADEENHSDHD